MKGFMSRIQLYILFVSVFQYIPWLATQLATDGLEGSEAYGLGLARLQDREVSQREADLLCQFAKRHFALSEFYV